jgi:hypothetical protein
VFASLTIRTSACITIVSRQARSIRVSDTPPMTAVIQLTHDSRLVSRGQIVEQQLGAEMFWVRRCDDNGAGGFLAINNTATAASRQSDRDLSFMYSADTAQGDPVCGRVSMLVLSGRWQHRHIRILVRSPRIVSGDLFQSPIGTERLCICNNMPARLTSWSA